MKFQLLGLLALLDLAALPLAAGPAAPLFTLEGHKTAVVAVAFSPNGKTLASVSDDGVLKLWDLAAKKELASTSVSSSNIKLRFTPDGKQVLAIGTQQSIVGIDVADGKAAWTITFPDLPSGPSAFDLSADGKWIAVVARGNLRILDFQSGAVKWAWDVHVNYSIRDVAFSPDAKYVATASTDHTSLVLECATGKIPATLNVVLNGERVVFSRDGKQVIACSSDHVARLFNVQDAQGHDLGNFSVAALTMELSSDGKLLVVASKGRAPMLITIPEGKLLTDVIDGPELSWSAAISADGVWIAAGTNTGPIEIWKLAH